MANEIVEPREEKVGLMAERTGHAAVGGLERFKAAAVIRRFLRRQRPDRGEISVLAIMCDVFRGQFFHGWLPVLCHARRTLFYK